MLALDNTWLGGKEPFLFGGCVTDRRLKAISLE